MTEREDFERWLEKEKDNGLVSLHYSVETKFPNEEDLLRALNTFNKATKNSVPYKENL